jgi:lipopolysaccharide transport system ATP-binding protein
VSKPIIEVQGIGKRYWLHGRGRGYRTLRDTLTETVAKPAAWMRSAFGHAGAAGGREAERAQFWALRDVSFDVAHGEVVGIIGRNGAGKSTLLKVLSRITEPTTGMAKVYGRVGSLLEVGTGFHPELSGRENIFLNGSILGMRKTEIARKFDEIVAFAEIEKFIDEPVKRYSSGMYMRLAFSVAAHLEPEVLFIDEVLAVGDAAFQKKCLGKMGSISKAGRTVLFVSHNMSAVQSLCTRAVWLNGGRVHDFGDTRPVVARYLQTAARSASEEQWKTPAEAPGNDKVRLKRVAVVGGGRETPITVETPFRIEIEFWNYLEGATLNAAVEIFNHEEICVFSSFSLPREVEPGLVKAVCNVPGNLLNDSMYRAKVFIVRDAREQLLVRDSVMFEAHDVEREVAYFGKWTGVVRPSLEWTTETWPGEGVESSFTMAGAAR